MEINQLDVVEESTLAVLSAAFDRANQGKFTASDKQYYLIGWVIAAGYKNKSNKGAEQRQGALNDVLAVIKAETTGSTYDAIVSHINNNYGGLK